MLMEGFEHGGGGVRSDSGKGMPVWPSFEVFHQYTLRTSAYGSAELQVMKILGIADLLSPGYWATMPQLGQAGIHGLLMSLGFATSQLPKVLELIEQDHVNEIRHGGSNVTPAYAGKAILTVILVEDEGQLSAPSRLVHVLNAVTELYGVLAVINDDSERELSVLACDSGSDKSFDF